MPKRVDHEQRRSFIAEAVRRIAADRGLEAVSLGEVATEAGVSKGQVQHYFPSKDAMLRHATTTLRAQVERRLTTAPTPDLAGLRERAIALLPLDAEGRDEALVANAFLARALKDEEIAARFRAGHAQLRAEFGARIAEAQEAGTVAPGLVAEQEADLLLSLIAGLGDALLLGHHTETSATALVDLHLSRIAA